MNDAAASPVSTTTFGSSGVTTALAIDRLTSTLYAASASQLSRASIAGSTLSFTSVGTLPATVRALAWSDHYGGPAQGGLYAGYGLPASPVATTPLVRSSARHGPRHPGVRASSLLPGNLPIDGTECNVQRRAVAGAVRRRWADAPRQCRYASELRAVDCG
jgi:hypothetical protein